LIFPYLASDPQLLMELCDMAKYVSSLELKPKHYQLLLQFAVYPSTSAYEYARPVPLPSDAKRGDKWLSKDSGREYKDAKNQIPKLIELKLIERVPEHPRLSRAKKYKLTKNGVYIVIAPQLTPSLLSNLLMDYDDHPMFRFFLYPLISVDTLSRLTGVSRGFIFRYLCSYLHDCCEEVEAANNYIEVEDVNKDLFVWEDIRTGNEGAKALCDFLADKFGWTWLAEAKIQKSDDKVLEIEGTGYRHVLIRLSEDRKKVNVSYKGKKEIELTVVDFFDEALHHALLVQKSRRLDESYIKQFAKDHYKLVQRLLFSIVSDESVDSDAVRVLVEDNTFREALEDVKVQFDQKYNRFDSIIKTLQGGQP
jgi:hypothetical protein